mmetsp:Transcript_19928/g.60221  ORF Transcript_19928/g.60221 Transcript_19928/m.60221 type:complete len:210 (+) Transcript_19928:2905-3534(+)
MRSHSFWDRVSYSLSRGSSLVVSCTGCTDTTSSGNSSLYSSFTSASMDPWSSLSLALFQALKVSAVSAPALPLPSWLNRGLVASLPGTLLTPDLAAFNAALVDFWMPASILLATKAGATDLARAAWVPKLTPGMSCTSTVLLSAPLGSVTRYRMRSATLFLAYRHSIASTKRVMTQAATTCTPSKELLGWMLDKLALSRFVNSKLLSVA